MDPYPSIAFGIELRLVSTRDGGRSAPLLNSTRTTWSYRPNWGLPSMVAPDQSSAPVLAFSRDEILPGETVHAVIVTLVPEMVAQWSQEVRPGTELPMYEGARVCGHGTVLWRQDVTLPLEEPEEQRFLKWLDDPTSSPTEA